jgi:type I restriction enzyme S subunit
VSEWKEYTLEDVIEKFIDYRGKTPQKTTAGIPLITAKVVKGGKINTPDEYIDLKDYDRWMRRGLPHNGDVVMTTEAPLGEVAQLEFKNKIALAQRIITMRGKKGVLYNTFLKYMLQSPLVKHRIYSRSSGTTVIGIKSSELKKVEIPIPPVSVQKRIASVLRNLDDKIALNLKMNETLEEMAMALYKHWFVDFGPFQDEEFAESELGMIPKGWKVKNLAEIVKTQYGYTASAFDENTGPHFLRITDIQNNFVSWDQVPYCKINDKNYEKYSLKKGDIVIARTGNSTGTVGYINSEVNAVFASFLVRLKPKDSGISPHLLYLIFTSQEYKSYMNNVASGSTRKGANAKIMTDFKIALPSQSFINEFTDKVNDLLELIEQNLWGNIELKKLRDYLLPKLLSGEIDVSQAEKQVEEVL